MSNEWQKRTTKELRTKIYEKFGGKCCRCGFSDERAFQIDHINGGGVQDLRKRARTTILKEVLEDKDNKYQLLCANCNWIKRYVNNELKSKGVTNE